MILESLARIAIRIEELKYFGERLLLLFCPIIILSLFTALEICQTK